MKNFVQDGGVISVIAPYAVSSGGGVQIGALVGVATHSAATGGPLEIKRRGVFDVAALSTDVAPVGTPVYWDDTNKRITTTATDNTLVGCLTEAKADGDVTARVYFDGCVR